MSGISVVIYGFNEAQNFSKVILEALSHLKLMTDTYQVVAIDDGSEDDSFSVLSGLQKQHPDLKIIRHKKRQGIGACLKDGFHAADLEYVTFLPADGQIDPADIKRCYQLMHEADMVTTYYSTNAFPFYRKILSKTMRLLVLILFGPSPRIEGFYMFRRDLLKSISLHCDSFAVNFEFVIKAYQKGFRIKQIPTQSRSRFSGKSKVVNFKTIRNVFGEIIKLRINFRS